MTDNRPPERGALLVWTVSGPPAPGTPKHRVVEFVVRVSLDLWRVGWRRDQRSDWPGSVAHGFVDPAELRPATKAESAAHLLLVEPSD